MYKEIAQLINKNQEFIVTSHVNPDGDSIGSEIALYKYLKKIGKDARIINYSATPANFTFLDKETIIEQFDEAKHKQAIDKADVIFILDTNEYERVRTMAPYIQQSSAKKVLIDHHLGFNNNGFDYYISDTESPATGEILYRFFKSIGDNVIDKDIAAALYTAIMTDTGSFKFDRTDSETHSIASELLSYGISPYEIYSEVYNRATIGRLHILGRFLNNIMLEYSDRFAYSTILQKDFLETGTDEYALKDLSSHLLSLETVQLAAVITETKRGIKLSFRSKGDVRANELAKEFGGGGHLNAAGAFVEGAQITELAKEVTLKAKKYIK
jgi:phosphoesterase RecJ-like protein